LRRLLTYKIKRIPEEKELKKAAKKQVMELMWDD
jgi:hypothetical protein